MDMENMDNEGLDCDPCEDALNLLWQEIVIAKQGADYGDWEYPGQAYRHIKAEFDDLQVERAAAREALAAITLLVGEHITPQNGSFVMAIYAMARKGLGV